MMKTINIKKPLVPRKTVGFDEPNQQTSIINKIYLNHDTPLRPDIEREINKKINGYKNQDSKKNILGDLITFDETIEKLVISKSRCYYCRETTKILYVYSRDPLQWTLDRIDNLKSHSCDNTVICCLQCNLQRRVRDSEKFAFTKQLNIVKS